MRWVNTSNLISLMLFSINSLIIKELTHYYLFCHYTVFHGLNPIFRWLYNTIFICSKNKNTWKLTAMRNKFQTWIMNTSNLICLRLYSINSLTTTEWKHCFFRFAITVFHGLNPIFRWLYDTIFICSKNKNAWKLAAVREKFQIWILNTNIWLSNIIYQTFIRMDVLWRKQLLRNSQDKFVCNSWTWQLFLNSKGLCMPVEYRIYWIYSPD